jgi:hypothetical protein
MSLALFIGGVAVAIHFEKLAPIFLILAISLVVATVINAFIIDRLTGLTQKWAAATIMTLSVFVGIFLFAASGGGSRRAAWSSRAKGTLRSIGSSQLAYQGANTEKLYGTFDALKKDLYIAEGYTLSNMIGNYSMTWQVNNISIAPSEEIPTGVMSSFTVIAWPRDRRKGYLHTFAVMDDQVVRVYNPKNKNRLSNVATWDPIL